MKCAGAITLEGDIYEALFDEEAAALRFEISERTATKVNRGLKRGSIDLYRAESTRTIADGWAALDAGWRGA